MNRNEFAFILNGRGEQYFEFKERFINLEKEIVVFANAFGGKIYSGKSSGKILELRRDNSQITIPEMAEILGLTTRAVEKNISKLQEIKKLKRIGGANGGHWKVNE